MSATNRVTAKGRKGMRHPASRIPREEIFLGHFPSHMKKNQEKMNFLLLKRAKSVIFCEKGRDSLLTSHCEKRFFLISLFACKKKRDCFLIFLFNDHFDDKSFFLNSFSSTTVSSFQLNYAQFY